MRSPCRMTIAVTGHRPNRIRVRPVRLMRRLRDVLKEARRGFGDVSPSGDIVAVSALAEGADRMFAEAALGLDYRLEVVLPFRTADYETTFGDASTTQHYRELVAAAARVTELSGSLTDRKAAYEAAGRSMAAAADILVAVWDGRPPAGRGGTPEIVAYAVSNGIPVIWIDASRDRPPMRLLEADAGETGRVALGAMAARAMTLRPRAIARLSADIARRARDKAGTV